MSTPTSYQSLAVPVTSLQTRRCAEANLTLDSPHMSEHQENYEGNDNATTINIIYMNGG